MKAMILAAGFGKRMLPLTETLPKPLLKVGDKSLIERNIDFLAEAGINEIVINIFYLAEMIPEYLNDRYPKIKISYSKEDNILGTGGGIKKALSFLGSKPFVLVNSDIYHTFSFHDFDCDVENAHLYGVKNPAHNQNGDFSIDDSNKIYIDSKNNLTWSGISIINPNIFKEIKKDSFDVWKDLLINLIAQKKITGKKIDDPWVDVGTIDRLDKANKMYNEKIKNYE